MAVYIHFLFLMYLFMEFVLKSKKAGIASVATGPPVRPQWRESGRAPTSIIEMDALFRNFDQTLSISGSTGGKKEQNNTVYVVLPVLLFFFVLFFFFPLL